MKEVIRRGLFETNSSSVHSITMCDDDTYTKWKNGELLIKSWNETFITREEANEEMKKDGINIEDEGEVYDYSRENGIFNYDDFWEYYEEYEQFDDEYETNSGEIVHAFGYYGHD